MLISFIHGGKAFLPELEAYTNFFSARGFQTNVALTNSQINPETSIAWFFMGTDNTQKIPASCIRIHEYSSLSVPPFSRLKDWVKKQLNKTPDYRIFLNNYIKQQLNFTDNVPYGYRDMGVEPVLTRPQSSFNYYDFVYCGDVSPVRGIEKILDVFSRPPMQDRSLLIISKDYDRWQQQYAKFNNIQFIGPLPRNKIPYYLQQATFAINFIPNKAPFNRQTSTKLLEYAAAKIPIISTRYHWVQEFEKKHGGAFFYLESDWSNFTWENIHRFTYQFPALQNFTWEKQILDSGIMDFLKKQSLFNNNVNKLLL
jgi:hypothetical protein